MKDSKIGRKPPFKGVFKEEDMAKAVLYCFPSRSVTLFQNGSKPPKNNTLGNVKAQGLSALLTKTGLYSKYKTSALSQDCF